MLMSLVHSGRARVSWADTSLAVGLLISAVGMCVSVPLVYAGYAVAAVGALLEPRRLAPFLVGWPWALALSAWMTLCGFLSSFEVSRVPPGWTYCWLALPIWALAASQPQRLALAMWGFASGAVLATTLAALQFFIGYGNDVPPWRIDRQGPKMVKASGFYSHWIRFGDAVAFAALALAAWLYRFRGLALSPIWWRCGVAAFLALGLAATFISNARGAFIAFIVGAWVLAASLLPWRRLGVFTVAMIVILGLTVALAWPTHGARIQNAMAGRDGRTYIWHTAWETFRQHPLTGVGHRGYDKGALATVAQGLSEAGPEGADMGNAHNSFLSLLVLYGVPGLFLWSAWLFSVGREIWGLRHRHPAAGPLLVATLSIFLVGSLTEDLAAYASSRFQLFFGLAVALGCARTVSPAEGELLRR